MGVVYQSFDPDIRRAVALKTIRKELLSDEDGAAAVSARFRREAQAAGRLLHPGIVTVYEYGEDAHFAFIAMEYVEGSSLRQYFERSVRFEEQDVVSIMVQLLDALQYAHDERVWHRDIKPANIIIMNNGRIKVADFGIARLESSTLTQVGALMGTPGFIAPEQYLGAEIDHRVDIFAAGVVFYELLTGKLPFSGSKDSVMYQVCHEAAQPPSVAAGNRALARFDAIALQALAKLPEERYASAGRFRADLLEAYDQPVSPTISEQTLMRNTGAVDESAEDSSPHGTPRKSAKGAPPAPSPSPAAPGPHSSTISTQILIAEGWNIDELGELEHSLINFVGPVARVMVRRATRHAKDFASVVKTLADQIRMPEDRAKFLQENARLAGTGTAPSRTARPVDDSQTVIPGLDSAGQSEEPGPSSGDIARATELLVDRLGPLGRILVREQVRPGVSRAAFLARVADRLSGSEKEQFLQDFERTGIGASRPAEIVKPSAPATPLVAHIRPSSESALSDAEIALATRLLVEYLGPLARILVPEAAARPGITRAAFLAELADRLTARERERFTVDFERLR
jgi:eukaryotic-like serine/threonine-protein kinase